MIEIIPPSIMSFPGFAYCFSTVSSPTALSLFYFHFLSFFTSVVVVQGIEFPRDVAYASGFVFLVLLELIFVLTVFRSLVMCFV